MNTKNNNILTIALTIIIIILVIICIFLFLKMEFLEEKYEYQYENSLNNNDNNSNNNNSNSNNNVNNQDNTNTKDFISRSEAENIALKSLNINAEDVYELKSELDYKFNTDIYEIEFKYDRHEYEFYINAKTGEIIKSFKERD